MNALTAQAASSRRRAPQEKRDLIMSAAGDLFAKQGYDNTSTQQIAQHAGVSEGILFHHFGSKKGLVLSLAQAYVQAATAATMPADPEAISEELVVRRAFDFAEANPALYDMMMKGGAALAELDLVAQSNTLVAAIAEKLLAGMATGRVRQGNAEIMAQLQFALVDAAYRAWRRSQNEALREAYITEAVNGMKAMLTPQPD